jgi:AcrR family transcriptional regulator
VLNSPSPTTTDEETLHAAAVVPTLQARKQQLVRDAIWDAATHLFAEKGFDETTVDDIAQAAGVSRRSFFRYFSSKSDLMAQGIVSYATALADAINACPQTYSLSEILKETVLQVAQQSAAHPRTRKIMEIAAKYPAAREAQLSRLAELQDRVADAFARRCRQASEHDLTPGVLAGLTLSVLSVTFRSWFERGQQDISITASQVFATLDRLIADDRRPSRRNVRTRRFQRAE